MATSFIDRLNERIFRYALARMGQRRKRLEGLRGNEVHCPCCEGSFIAFLPFGVDGRKRAHALCPACGSLERHRLMWLFIQERTPLLKQRQRLLHVAPEPFYFGRLSKDPLVDYVAGDKFAPGYSYPAGTIDLDVTSIAFPDNSFDAVICSHVLEHVPDDALGMRELLRVLRPGGWAIIDVPMNKDLAHTDEDITITDPKERERRFGQHDHFRLYGLDLRDRLAQAGFEVDVVAFANGFSTQDRFRMGLSGREVYHCRKP